MKQLFISALTLLLALPAFAIDPITGPGYVCSGSTITLSDATTGGTWSSSDVAVATVDASGVVTGTLATTAPGTVMISYTAGASNATTIVTVYPVPVLSSTLTPPSICDSSLFTYVPTSLVASTSFTWIRPYMPGIAATMGSGAGGVSEELDNVTFAPLVVKYLFTLTAYGCSNDDTVQVIVNPKPHLSSATTASTCSGAAFSYTPTSPSPGTTFAWSRAAVSGISNAPGAGTGNISETLVNTTSSPITVTYVFTMTNGACTTSENVQVVVNPCINGIPEVNLQNVTVYPNPNQGVFTVTMPVSVDNSTTATITIKICWDSRCRKCGRKQIGEETIRLDVPPGIYLLKACSSAGVFETKVVVR
jgi:hypothetical protein